MTAKPARTPRASRGARRRPGRCPPRGGSPGAARPSSTRAGDRRGPVQPPRSPLLRDGFPCAGVAARPAAGEPGLGQAGAPNDPRGEIQDGRHRDPGIRPPPLVGWHGRHGYTLCFSRADGLWPRRSRGLRGEVRASPRPRSGLVGLAGSVAKSVPRLVRALASSVSRAPWRSPCLASSALLAGPRGHPIVAGECDVVGSLLRQWLKIEGLTVWTRESKNRGSP